MKIFEIINEELPSDKEIGRMQQDADALQKMSASGKVDPNLAKSALQRMMTTAAKADVGSQMLKIAQMFATAYKEGIDSGVYGNKVGEMQTAYDQIMAGMPMLKQMAVDSKRMAAKYGTPSGNLTKELNRDGTYKGTNITPTKMQKDRLTSQNSKQLKNIAGDFRKSAANIQKFKRSPEVEDQTKRDFAPTKADAMSAQGTAAVLKSKRDSKPSIEMMKIMNQAMKNMIAQKIKFANNVSKSSGTDPKAVDKMLAKQPPLTAKNAKFKDKFSKTNETASGMGSSSIASVPNGVGAMQSRNMYNADGTMKNGVEYGNLLGGKTKKNKKKSKKPNA
jgi:hypothetical protein